MATGIKNLAKMTVSGTPGTGTITLGSASAGFLTFAQAGVPDGAQVSYGIIDGTNSEAGRGRYTASGTTLSRDIIYESTNSGSAVSLTSAAVVFITGLAEDFVENQLVSHSFFGGVH